MTTPQAHAALQGIKVLDFSRMLPGPWATQMLADLGADVIKVEEPGVGDLGRHNTPNFKVGSVYFNTVNLNKRGLALNLATAEDRAVAQALMREADVVVESFRGGVTDRLGIDYETARRLKPDIVYCSITGFGQTGPLAGVPGHDLVVQATTGAMGTGEPGTKPPVPGFQCGDYAAANTAVIAILAALQRRSRTGEGGHLDVSLYDSMMSMMNIVGGLALARQAGHHGTPKMELWGGNPRYDTYLCADGKPVAVSLLEARIWGHFCQVIGRPELFDPGEGPEQRHTHHGERGALYRQALTAFCASMPRDELIARMAAADVPIVPVYTPEEALASAHARAREVLQWIDHPSEGRIPVLSNPLARCGLTTGERRPAPDLGAQGRPAHWHRDT